MCITVPPVYPLEPCQIEIMNENLEDWRLMLVLFFFFFSVGEHALFELCC
jgi:hypothetical protein